MIDVLNSQLDPGIKKKKKKSKDGNFFILLIKLTCEEESPPFHLKLHFSHFQLCPVVKTKAVSTDVIIFALSVNIKLVSEARFTLQGNVAQLFYY